MNRKAENSSESGNALIEFAIALPLFLIIIFGGFEIAGSLSAVQEANHLSREIAATAYRECAFDGAASSDETPASSYMNADSCLSEVVARFENDTATLLPNTRFSISLFNASGAGVEQSGHAASSGTPTKFSTANFTSNTSALNRSLKNTLDGHRTVVVSEVYVNRNSMVGSIPVFWNLAFASGTSDESRYISDQIYASAIY